MKDIYNNHLDEKGIEALSQRIFNILNKQKSYPLDLKEDILQEIRIKIYSALQGYKVEKEVPLESYMFVVCERRIIDFLKSHKVHRRYILESELFSEDEEEVHLENLVQENFNEQNLLMDEFLDNRLLTDVERQFLILSLEGHSSRSIATSLGYFFSHGSRILKRIQSKYELRSGELIKSCK